MAIKSTQIFQYRINETAGRVRVYVGTKLVYTTMTRDDAEAWVKEELNKQDQLRRRYP